MAGDLAKTQTGEPVQTQEKTIVHDLDVLIAELEKQCDNCKGRHEEEQADAVPWRTR